MLSCGYRGCAGGRGKNGKQYTNQALSESLAVQHVGSPFQSEILKLSSRADMIADDSKKAPAPPNSWSSKENKAPPQRHANSDASDQMISETKGVPLSMSLGSLVDNFFQPMAEEEKKESFWVSSSLAAWLTGKDQNPRQTVKDIVEQAIDPTDCLKSDGSRDDDVQSSVGIDVDFTVTDHTRTKLIITGEPEKRKQAIDILKELTSKCQRDSASSLIDSWQMFSDNKLREERPTKTSSRGHPRFGLSSTEVAPGGAHGGEHQDETLRKKQHGVQNGSFMSNLRRTLVSKSERDIKALEEEHKKHHWREQEEVVKTQTLQLLFPSAALLARDPLRFRFEAELQAELRKLLKGSCKLQRVVVNFHDKHIAADVVVPDGKLEDARQILSEKLLVVCSFRAFVPEALKWCPICCMKHEPDKQCLTNFQTDVRFDESLTSFLGELRRMELFAQRHQSTSPMQLA